jgi:DNA helicase-2/ATP-dependent DNA helicase PcrA
MAGFRVARLLPGIGPATASKLIDLMDHAANPLDAMASFDTPQATAGDWQALVSLFRLLRQENSTWPAEMDLVARWYAPHLQRIYEDAPVRQGDLVQLQQIASTYPSRERFLTELTLDPPSVTSAQADAPGLDDDYLVLSTIHSAKGQEWKTVHVLNVIDGCIPSDMSTGTSEEIEEERRLLYVAMTRAKDHLHLMLPQRFYVHQQTAHGDRHVYALRSRFIPNSITRLFESCAWPTAAPDLGVEEPPVTLPSRQVDISARIRASWR